PQYRHGAAAVSLFRAEQPPQLARDHGAGMRSTGDAGVNPADEVERLRREIREHDRRYYVLAELTTIDLEYDRLNQRLKSLEAAHPELVTPDSPTQRIGDEPVDGLVSVTHRVPMMSIDNTYDLDELKAFGTRTAKQLPGEKIEWVVELK